MATATKVIVGVEQEPRIQFTMYVAGDALPDLIELPDGSLIVKHGKYASPGERWAYRRVLAPMLLSDRDSPRPWVQYTELEG